MQQQMTTCILGDKPFKTSSPSKTLQDKNKQFAFCLHHYLSFPFTGKFSFPRLVFTQSKQGKKNPLKSLHVGGQGIAGVCFLNHSVVLSPTFYLFYHGLY